MLELTMRFPEKEALFLRGGYSPHYWQRLGHHLTARWQVVDAGRRGGKTRFGSREMAARCCPLPITIYKTDDDGKTLYDSNNQPIFERESTVQREILGKLGVNMPSKGDPFIGLIVTPTFKKSKSTMRDFQSALRSFDYQPYKSASATAKADRMTYEWNKTEKIIGIPSIDEPECIINIVSADDPESSVGDGYHMVWIDEAAGIRSIDFWDALRPALGQTEGVALLTSTPGRNDANWWIHDLFYEKETYVRNTDRVGWWSVSSPHFSMEEFEELRETSHPHIFRRENMGLWERSGGEDLKEHWVQFFTEDQLHQTETGTVDWSKYSIFIGVDLASEVSARADYFAVAVVAKDKETGRGYVVDLFEDKLTMPDQLAYIDDLNSFWSKHVDYPYIGVENTGYQRTFVQMAQRLPSMPDVEGVPATGRKEERLLNLGPAFRSTSFRLRDPEDCSRGTQRLAFDSFMRQWLEFPNSKNDDLLDAVEIAMRTGGTWFNVFPDENEAAVEDRPVNGRPSIQDVEEMEEEFYDEW